MSKKTDKIIKVLGNLFLDDTRAYDAAWQIGLMEKRCKNITRSLQNVYEKIEDYEEKPSQENKDKIVFAIEEYAKSQTDPESKFFVNLTPFQRPVWADCFMLYLAITGKEIWINGGKTTDAAEFLNDEGQKILSDIKMTLMSSFVTWLKSKGVANPIVKDADNDET